MLENRGGEGSLAPWISLCFSFFLIS